MDKILTLPDSDERKAKMNENFKRGLFVYNLVTKTFNWISQIEQEEPINLTNN